MKKFRTTKDYSALITAMAEELMHKTKYELAALLAYEKVSELMKEEFDYDHQPKLDEMRAATEKEEARIDKLRDFIDGNLRNQINDLNQELRAAPQKLARRGPQAKQQKNLPKNIERFHFLDKQTDISNTQLLARRLDRQFGIKGRQPLEGEKASGPAVTLVQSWKKFRSICQQNGINHRHDAPERRDS